VRRGQRRLTGPITLLAVCAGLALTSSVAWALGSPATSARAGTSDVSGKVPRSHTTSTTPPVPAFSISRAIVLSPSMVELVDNGSVTGTFRLTAEGAYTIPQIASIIGQPGWLTSTAPGVWLLQAALIAGPGTSLQIASPAVTTLRLAMGDGAFVGGERAYASIDHVSVTSWNVATAKPETVAVTNRPFLLFQNGSTIVFVGASLENLGSDQIGASGVTWKNDPEPGSATDTAFSGNESGAVVMKSGPISFSGDTFTSNATDGLQVDDNTSAATVIGSAMNGNEGAGVVVERSHGAFRIASSTADHNAVGIEMQHVSGSQTLSSDAVTDNAQVGIALRNADNALVQHVTTKSNSTGLEISDASYGVRVSDLRSSGDRVGVHVNNSFVPKLTELQIHHSTRIGIIANSKRLVIDHADISSSPVAVEVRKDTRIQRSDVLNTDRALTVWPNQSVTVTNTRMAAHHIGVELGSGALAYVAHSSIAAPEATRGGHTQSLSSNLSHPRISLLLVIPGAGLLLICVLMELLLVFRQRNDPRVVAPKRIWNVS
jgi:hypothetical protein